MKKIKILEAIRQGNFGGGESHLLDLVTHMDKSRFEPVVLSFTSGAMVDEMRRRGIKVKVIYTKRAFDFSVWKKIRDFIIEEQIDIVHAHGTRANSNVFWAAKRTKRPLIYTIHGWSFHIDQKYPVRKIREFSERFLTSLSDKVICVSKSNEQDGIKLFNMKRSTVIYNAVDLEKFSPYNNYKDIRQELGISSDKTVVGYIVRITKQKDPLTMLKAMKKLDGYSDNNIVLLMVGDGELKDQALKLAKKLKIEDKVISQPFRADIPEVLNAIDIYCLPSLWEGFPIGILEAMAMKKAIVASPVDGTREMIKDGETGLFVNYGKPKDLAEALKFVSKDTAFRDMLARNAFKYVRENLGIASLVEDVQKLYKQLLVYRISV